MKNGLERLGSLKDWKPPAVALTRIVEGERNPESISSGLELDEVASQSLFLTLGAIRDDEALRALVALARQAENEQQKGACLKADCTFAIRARSVRPACGHGFEPVKRMSVQLPRSSYVW